MGQIFFFLLCPYEFRGRSVQISYGLWINFHMTVHYVCIVTWLVIFYLLKCETSAFKDSCFFSMKSCWFLFLRLCLFLCPYLLAVLSDILKILLPAIIGISFPTVLKRLCDSPAIFGKLLNLCVPHVSHSQNGIMVFQSTIKRIKWDNGLKSPVQYLVLSKHSINTFYILLFVACHMEVYR